MDEARRPPGRPRIGDPVITPDILEVIGREWLRGATVEVIASAVGCAPSTVWHHINRTIRPRWCKQLDQALVDELAKILAIERIAWEHFEKSEAVQTEQTLREGLEKGVADELGGDGGLFDDVGDGLQIIERITKKVKRFANPTWLSVVQWAVELRLKVGGHLAGNRLESEHSIRVAGLSPAELDRKMFDRFMDHLAARGRIFDAPRRERPK